MDEIYCGCDKAEIKESHKNFGLEENKELKDVSTAVTIPQPQTQPQEGCYTFHRVISANDMILFQEQEDGPLKGQVTRAVQTKENVSKAIFFVYPEANPEDEYRNKVDYANPVLLRVKTLSRLPSLNSSLSKFPPQVNIQVNKQSSGCNDIAKFNFNLCKEDIFSSPFER